MSPVTPPPPTWWELFYYGWWRITATLALYYAFVCTLVFLAVLLSVFALFHLVFLCIVFQNPFPFDDDATRVHMYDPVAPLISITSGVGFVIVMVIMLLLSIVHPPLNPEVLAGRAPARHLSVCAVCLSEVDEDYTLCLMAKCDRKYHLGCIGKWLAVHVTCPVCRADLTSQPVVHSASQLAKSGTEPQCVEVKVEVALPDGGAPERSPRERIQPPDLRDKNESGKQLMDRPEPILALEGCSRQ